MFLFGLLFALSIVTAKEILEYGTNVIWSNSRDTHYRPLWSGNVTVLYDEWIDDRPGQIWSVSGTVLPISTSGRPSAPDPWNGYEVGTAVGLDRGHIMALSNGGPDISRNIVPQSAQWQRTGGWRGLETAVQLYAAYKYKWITIPHASEVWNITEPKSECNVIFAVDMLIYNNISGEPMMYNGSVSCNDERYSFTISPPPGNDTAYWYPQSPPADSSEDPFINRTILMPNLNRISFMNSEFMDSAEVNSGSLSTSIKTWTIAVIIGSLITSICVVLVVVSCRKRTRKNLEISELLPSDK